MLSYENSIMIFQLLISNKKKQNCEKEKLNEPSFFFCKISVNGTLIRRTTNNLNNKVIKLLRKN